MPGFNCCVPGCNNNTKKDSKKYSFYSFPKEKQLRETWIKNIARAGTRGPPSKFIPTTGHRVCSVHFTGGKKTYLNNIPKIFPLHRVKDTKGRKTRSMEPAHLIYREERSIMTKAIPVLCKNVLKTQAAITIEGLIGITHGAHKDVFMIRFCQTFVHEPEPGYGSVPADRTTRECQFEEKKSVLRKAVPHLCRNVMKDHFKLGVQGLICISLEDPVAHDAFWVSFCDNPWNENEHDFPAGYDSVPDSATEPSSDFKAVVDVQPSSSQTNATPVHLFSTGASETQTPASPITEEQETLNLSQPVSQTTANINDIFVDEQMGAVGICLPVLTVPLAEKSVSFSVSPADATADMGQAGCVMTTRINQDSVQTMPVISNVCGSYCEFESQVDVKESHESIISVNKHSQGNVLVPATSKRPPPLLGPYYPPATDDMNTTSMSCTKSDSIDQMQQILVPPDLVIKQERLSPDLSTTDHGNCEHNPEENLDTSQETPAGPAPVGNWGPSLEPQSDLNIKLEPGTSCGAPTETEVGRQEDESWQGIKLDQGRGKEGHSSSSKKKSSPTEKTSGRTCPQRRRKESKGAVGNQLIGEMKQQEEISVEVNSEVKQEREDTADIETRDGSDIETEHTTDSERRMACEEGADTPEDAHNEYAACADKMSPRKSAGERDNKRKFPQKVTDPSLSETCYKCEACGMEFMSVNDMTEHNKQEHPKQWSFRLMENATKAKDDSREGRKKKTEKGTKLMKKYSVNNCEKHVCNVCGFSFKTQQLLHDHLASDMHRKMCTMRGLPVKCTKKPPRALHVKKAKQLKYNPQHMKETHYIDHGYAKCMWSEKLSLYCCKRCDWAFREEHEIEQHMCFHTGQMPFYCSECDVAFRYKCNWKGHMQSHKLKQNP